MKKMDDMKKIIGSRVRKRRKEFGLSQTQLAENLNISNNHLSSIENGKKGMSRKVMSKICDELKITPDYLILGALHSNNVPRDIYERLQTFGDRKLALARAIIEVIGQWDDNDE